MERRQKGRRRARESGAEDKTTRRRVFKAAARLFAQRGYGMTSVRDIARVADIRVSTLYHYCRGKSDLYEQVLQAHHESLRAIVGRSLEKHLEFRDQVVATIGAVFDHLCANPEIAQLGLRSILSDGGRARHRYEARWIGLMEGLLLPQVARGHAKDIDPALLLITMAGILDIHVGDQDAYRRLFGGKDLRAPELARRTRDHITRVALSLLGTE